MARLIWTEPSLRDLDTIAEYIALDNPRAARRLVARVFEVAERLKEHPLSGKRVTELDRSPYRELVVPPCRVFYRPDKNAVYILHVTRGERLFRAFLIAERDKQAGKA